MVPGSCLPRSVLYTHYQDFCKKNQVEASSAASFGKVATLSLSLSLSLSVCVCALNMPDDWVLY